MSEVGNSGNNGNSGFGLNFRRSPDAPSGGNTSAGADGKDAWGHPVKKADDVNKTTNTDPNTVTNGGVDDKMVDDLWNDITKKPVVDANKPQEIIVKQEPVPLSGAEQLKQHLQSVGLGEFTLSEAEKAELQAGNFDTLTTKMHEMAVNSYTKALSGSQTLIEAKVREAVDKAVGDSKAYVEGRDSLAALHAAVPATKHPAIGPVAQTVMQRLLDRGASKEQAIEGVKKWSQLFAKEMGFNVEVNGNRNGSFRGGQTEGSGAENWLNILSGKSS